MGKRKEKAEKASFIMHAFLCVMSLWYSQSPEFPLSRLSLRQWCQAVAEKKDDFINDLINHQNSPYLHIALFICPSFLSITVP